MFGVEESSIIFFTRMYASFLVYVLSISPMFGIPPPFFYMSGIFFCVVQFFLMLILSYSPIFVVEDDVCLSVCRWGRWGRNTSLLRALGSYYIS
jgi:hypothetical protein